MTSTEKMYMNFATGSVGTYDEWWYENESGETVNAVDLHEVTEVVSDGSGWWVQADA